MVYSLVSLSPCSLWRNSPFSSRSPTIQNMKNRMKDGPTKTATNEARRGSCQNAMLCVCVRVSDS